jgi:hypothetical protein
MAPFSMDVNTTHAARIPQPSAGVEEDLLAKMPANLHGFRIRINFGYTHQLWIHTRVLSLSGSIHLPKVVARVLDPTLKYQNLRA